MDNRSRLLFIEKILLERSGENHPISTQEIAEILENEYGVLPYRSTIASDIESLQRAGVDIQNGQSAAPPTGAV